MDAQPEPWVLGGVLLTIAAAVAVFGVMSVVFAPNDKPAPQYSAERSKNSSGHKPIKTKPTRPKRGAPPVPTVAAPPMPTVAAKPSTVGARKPTKVPQPPPAITSLVPEPSPLQSVIKFKKLPNGFKASRLEAPSEQHMARAESGGGGGKLSRWHPAAEPAFSFAQQTHMGDDGFARLRDIKEKCVGVDLDLDGSVASLYGICEANGSGFEVADWARRHMVTYLLAAFDADRWNHNNADNIVHLRFEDEITAAGLAGTKAQLARAFLACDRDLLRKLPSGTVEGQGATGCFLFVRRNTETDQRYLYCANVGNVEAVLAREREDGEDGLEAVIISTKHDLQTKAGRADARTRLPPHSLTCSDGRYLMHGLEAGAFPRSFGNGVCKPSHIGGRSGGTAMPALWSQELTGKGQFVVLASEGFWLHVTPQDAVDEVLRNIEEGTAASDTASALKTVYMEAAVAASELSYDMTVMVVFLP
jgi:serine/threonine protein phosphatase PrpC